MSDQPISTPPSSAPARRRRKERIGVVTSDKMTRTVTVRLTRRITHPTYGKRISRTRQFKARNEVGARAGDLVRIQETRPLAKTVHWRVAEILTRAE